MKTAKSDRRVVLMLFGVFISVAAVAFGIQAAQPNPDFAISISPTSQSVQRGQTATYTVTVTSLQGFNSAVSLSVSGGPAGTGLSATSVTPATGASATTTLTVATTSSTNTGSYTITVNGVSGKLKHSASTGLTVNYPLSQSFSLAMTPSSLAVNAGSSGAYNVVLSRTNFTGAVALSIFGSLPAGVTSATFSPTTLSGTTSSSTLTVVTDGSAKAGSTTIYIVGSSGSTYAYAQGTLVIATPQGKPFTISSGSIGALSPGMSRPIDLTLTNTNNSAISVTNLTVSLTSTSRSTCPVADFAVTQYTGSYPITVPSNGTTSLHTTSTSSSTWPAITMRNTTSNQDSCKGVTLSLAYSGSAQGN